MLTSPALYDLSKYQKDVDDVIIWDRHGIHKGFLGMFKFIKEFPYKKVFPISEIICGENFVISSKEKIIFDNFSKAGLYFLLNNSVLNCKIEFIFFPFSVS